MHRALFAWEGFSFTHPEDWSPVSLTGSRAQGYARLQGPGRIGCQVRWQKKPKKLDLELALDNYLRLLKRDASRAKLKLRTEQKLENERLVYRWVGASQGRGAILSAGDRLYILEVVGGPSDSLLPFSNALLESFQNGATTEMECWSLFGLRVRLPNGLSPISKSLQSGRTWLTFRPRGATIEAGRYAFGKELVEKHGLEPWARAALNMRSAKGEIDKSRLCLVTSPALRAPSKALVRLDEENNQLLIVRSTSKSPKWSPDWKWLDSSDS